MPTAWTVSTDIATCLVDPDLVAIIAVIDLKRDATRDTG